MGTSLKIVFLFRKWIEIQTYKIKEKRLNHGRKREEVRQKQQKAQHGESVRKEQRTRYGNETKAQEKDKRWGTAYFFVSQKV